MNLIQFVCLGGVVDRAELYGIAGRLVVYSRPAQILTSLEGKYKGM